MTIDRRLHGSIFTYAHQPRRGFAVAGAGLILLVALSIYTYEPARFLYERAVFYSFPTAERALAYGDNHFSSLNARMYDLDAARYFYDYAYALDPKLPLLSHQLARVAFLRGDNVQAMFFINRELTQNPDPIPSSYYVRGLIEGYMGDYDKAAEDYAKFISLHGTINWASQNDYAWVLLKAKKPGDAHAAAERGLSAFPENPWLLNTDAIALYEMGSTTAAKKEVALANQFVTKITPQDWLVAYPGNDPASAEEGIQTLRKSIEANMHTIESGSPANAVQFP